MKNGFDNKTSGEQKEELYFLTSLAMVNVMKGVLVECDPAMKQFLLHLDETQSLGRKFIIQDLDERHLFISTDIIETLQARVDDLMDRISVSLHEKET